MTGYRKYVLIAKLKTRLITQIKKSKDTLPAKGQVWNLMNCRIYIGEVAGGALILNERWTD